MALAADLSTLIGRGPTLLRSHWSRASLVMLGAILCHKEPTRRIQSTRLGALERKKHHWGIFCLLNADSLWHKDSWPRKGLIISWFFMA